MGRLLFWILLGGIAYAVIKGWMQGGARGGPGPVPGKGDAESIVRCEACGLNVPESDAFSRAGRWYCSREHLESSQTKG